MLRANDLLEQISSEMGILPPHLAQIVRTAPLRYKVFYIEKKKLGTFREVAQPAREVKAIQYWIINRFNENLPVHAAATAYLKGASIKANALRHASSNYILKMDFKNFFPSILSVDIERHLESYCPEMFDQSARALISRVCCWAPKRKPPLRLCIGAPTSPMLSNSIMHRFDELVSGMALEDGVEYTRYADDLTFSSERANVLGRYPDHISRIVSELEYPRLELNSAKTVFASRAGHRKVTGIVLTPTKTLSIGRVRKRLIRAMFHRNSLGLLNQDEKEKLAGLLAFADSIEPGFTARLSRQKEV
jgi:retron-type reverse transcriptase